MSFAPHYVHWHLQICPSQISSVHINPNTLEMFHHIVKKLLNVLLFQEAKMLVARAYKHTEKLLQDNRDKLTLVSYSSM